MGFGVAALARFASEGWWGKKDSNLRSHKTADLQSAPFATRDTPPLSNLIASLPAEVAEISPSMTLKTRRLIEAPAGRVYERMAMAKSTKASGKNANIFRASV